MAIIGLYEVKTVDGEMITDSAPLKEIADILDVSVSTIQNAIYQGYALRGRYNIKKVDEKIARARDQALLINYDLTRNKILKYFKAVSAGKEKNDRDCKC